MPQFLDKTVKSDRTVGMHTYVKSYTRLLKLLKPKNIVEWGPGKSPDPDTIKYNTDLGVAEVIKQGGKVYSIESNSKYVPVGFDAKYQETIMVPIENSFDEKIDYSKYAKLPIDNADIYFVDGLRYSRSRCLDEIRKSAKGSYVIFLHDSQRPMYQDAIRKFKDVANVFYLKSYMCIICNDDTIFENIKSTFTLDWSWPTSWDTKDASIPKQIKWFKNKETGTTPLVLHGNGHNGRGIDYHNFIHTKLYNKIDSYDIIAENDPDCLNITVANKTNTLLEHFCDKFGVQLKVIKQDNKIRWNNHMKTEKTYEYLQSLEVKPKYIMFMDSLDVFPLCGTKLIVDTFKQMQVENPELKMLFNADPYPYPGLTNRKFENDNKSSSWWSLNSGCWIGEYEWVMEFLGEVYKRPHSHYPGSDQATWQDFYSRALGKIVLDQDCEIFQTLIHLPQKQELTISEGWTESDNSDTNDTIGDNK